MTRHFLDITDLSADELRLVSFTVQDQEYAIDIADVHPIPDDSFCRECGQIGCGHAVWTD